jgi:hypothetical protein
MIVLPTDVDAIIVGDSTMRPYKSQMFRYDGIL